MLRKIAKHELIHAQIALLLAIALQFVAWRTHHGFSAFQMVIIAAEIALVVIVASGAILKTLRSRSVHKTAAFVLLGLMSAANISSLIVVLQSLVTSGSELKGLGLLLSAIVIFVTNVIVYGLWYWEIDSPGLSSASWSKYDKDFQFTQQDLASEFPNWRPQFIDYLYVSMTNAVNFAPADTRPLTRGAKLLMGSQALISAFTIAIVLARSVSILG